jgi:hypothetical protein
MSGKAEMENEFLGEWPLLAQNFLLCLSPPADLSTPNAVPSFPLLG